jgi:hypothetical protein
MNEKTATLIVSDWYSNCSACGQQVLPESQSHDTISGYGPSRPGCGARFTAIATHYRDITPEILHDMRPDLPILVNSMTVGVEHD